MIEKREKRSQITKRVCRGRVRAFNLPIRSLGRYPYTTGSERICGRILSNTLGLETQECSETVFTTLKQRTVHFCQPYQFLLNQCCLPSMVQFANMQTFLEGKEFECNKCKATFKRKFQRFLVLGCFFVFDLLI